MRPPLVPGLLLSLLAIPGVSAQGAPDPDLLEARGAATQKRLEKDAAEWQVVHGTRGGASVVIDVLHTPAGTRRVFAIALPNQPRRELLRVVEREQAWYVSEAEGVRGIYRPREAPFRWPQAYQYLADSALLTVRQTAALGMHVETRAERATYRRPLPRAQRAQLQTAIGRLEQLIRARPKLEKQAEARIEQARRALAQGIACDVDVTNGILRRYGPPDRRAHVTRFRWLESVPLTAFALDGPALVDRRARLAGDRPNDLVLLAHNGLWKSGRRPYGLDSRLVDLGSGKVRRVPYQGRISLPGCFLPGRGSVVVCGANEVGMGLYRIDLDTGKNHRLGGARLKRGVCMSPTLSPDGKTLAVLHLRSPQDPKVQIYLVTVADGSARPLGRPLVANRVTWFPDGLSLLLSRRIVIDPKNPREELVRVDLLRGRVKRLRSGSSPALIRGGKTILFRDRTGWKTCDLAGQGARPLGDGLVQLNNPAPSADGSRVLMLRNDRAGPVPVVVNAETGAPTPVKISPRLAKGLWGFPAWR